MAAASRPAAAKIVGDGPLADMVRETAARDPAIEWLGRRSLEETLTFLGEAVCLVMPSIWYETFGRTIIEAYAEGTPAIASRLGAMTEMVDEGRTGYFFQAGDSADLAARVGQLLDQPLQLQRLRQAVRDEFQQKFTAERNYRLLLAIYEQAAHRVRGTPGAVGKANS